MAGLPRCIEACSSPDSWGGRCERVCRAWGASWHPRSQCYCFHLPRTQQAERRTRHGCAKMVGVVAMVRSGPPARVCAACCSFAVSPAADCCDTDGGQSRDAIAVKLGSMRGEARGEGYGRMVFPPLWVRTQSKKKRKKVGPTHPHKVLRYDQFLRLTCMCWVLLKLALGYLGCCQWGDSLVNQVVEAGRASALAAAPFSQPLFRSPVCC